VEITEIEVRVRVQLPRGADAQTVERLAMEAGHRAAQEVVRQAAGDEERPTECRLCGKRGQ
jgi:hypothetical protein